MECRMGLHPECFEKCDLIVNKKGFWEDLILKFSVT